MSRRRRRTGRTKHPFNKTQIKNGRIVIMRKDGRIKSDLGPYKKKLGLSKITGS